ncbi:MAG TPA: hypothetical protein VIJ28_22335 [Chloroflexota bacterium]|jgi:hypothetical protein
MREIIYAMQFTGRAAPKDAATPTVLKATTTAPSCSLTSTAGPEGIRGSLQRVAGAEATFESEVVFSDASTFQESGTIAFGQNGHRLRFSTIGQGYLGPSADPTRKHGTVMWKVDEGEGQFAGASGLITSNFFVSDTGEVTDHHFGVIFVR